MPTIVVTSAQWSTKGRVAEVTAELTEAIRNKLQVLVNLGAAEDPKDPATALLAVATRDIHKIITDMKEEYPVAALATKDLLIELVVDGAENGQVYKKDGILARSEPLTTRYGYHYRYPAYSGSSASSSAKAIQDAWDEMNDTELWRHFYH